MAAAYPYPLSAAQIGTYFVGQYYQVLQQQPEIVHQFYSEASTMLRIDGHTRETATAMLQIHSLVMSISYTGVEIKTIHSLESWSGGVLMMISGSVQLKNFNGSRKFMQTFFLAPQETGFFILNDIFHFVEEEQAHHYHHHPAVLLAQNNLNTKLTAPHSNQDSGTSFKFSPFLVVNDCNLEILNRRFGKCTCFSLGVDFTRILTELDANSLLEFLYLHSGNRNRYLLGLSNLYAVPSYMLSREIPARDFASAEVKDNGSVDNFNVVPELLQQQVQELEKVHEGTVAVESNGPNQSTTNNALQDQSPASVDEASVEQQKHTYASILRVAKGQSPPSAGLQTSASTKNVQPTTSEWDQIPEMVNQQAVDSPNVYDRSVVEAAEEVSGLEDEGEIKSVYVRNLPSTVSESEIEEEFKKFGRIRVDGVVIRGRKDLGVCYAFVEFEDMLGVHNAFKAATAQVAGRQVYIEERRPNSSVPTRSRRGRGRGSYPSEAPRARYGSRNFSRGNVHEGGDREYNNRSRGNGFYRPNNQQERGSSGVQVSSRSGKNSQE